MSSKIWKAILKDDVVKLKNSIESEGDVNLNSYNKEGLTLLLFGIEKGCAECCYYLVNERNVNIFLKDKKEKDNALMKCMILGQDMINVSRLLIEKKIDVNEKNKNGKTSLHIASEYNYVKGIELLIKNHAQINALDNEGNTPLMCSIKRSKEEAAILLIEKGADVNIKDGDMNSVLHICAKEHLGNIAQSILLTQKVDIKNCLDGENNSPLHIAAKENQKGLCDLFLKHKFDGYLKNNNNETYEDILKKHEKNDILKEEEKKKNYQEKEIRKRKNYEEAMLKTDVSNFLKLHNLESLIPHFYKHNYVYVDQAFLDVNDSTLKKMNLSKEERHLFYEAVDKHYSQIEDEENEQELANRQLQEEQRRTKRLKLVSYVVSLIFTAIFIYSIVISLLKRGRIFF
ncbi:Ankyrin [Plasmodium coatneyi]|uniref:Ankyrin n=1 Tax=Plasmodium coatneyi TaxID=208452 RepID=A0A1B1E5M7_9APIC|nr:Ankyrin [Plasmodium coatneyi]ANQ10260.1 Ankyrin [Plasmodium coatneyi]